MPDASPHTRWSPSPGASDSRALPLASGDRRPAAALMTGFVLVLTSLALLALAAPAQGQSGVSVQASLSFGSVFDDVSPGFVSGAVAVQAGSAGRAHTLHEPVVVASHRPRARAPICGDQWYDPWMDRWVETWYDCRMPHFAWYETVVHPPVWTTAGWWGPPYGWGWHPQPRGVSIHINLGSRARGPVWYGHDWYTARWYGPTRVHHHVHHHYHYPAARVVHAPSLVIPSAPSRQVRPVRAATTTAFKADPRSAPSSAPATRSDTRPAVARSVQSAPATGARMEAAARTSETRPAQT
ncbi:MAG: hypothetical protein EA352_02030, partial [Gemmatimonadales bacterium]